MAHLHADLTPPITGSSSDVMAIAIIAASLVSKLNNAASGRSTRIPGIVLANVLSVSVILTMSCCVCMRSKWGKKGRDGKVMDDEAQKEGEDKRAGDMEAEKRNFNLARLPKALVQGKERIRNKAAARPVASV